MNDLVSRQAAIDVIEAGRLTKLIDVNGLMGLPSAQPEYEPVIAEDFAKTMSENTIYSFRAWHSMALVELMEKQGFVICKKTM